jgi:hypothetical protein
VTGAAVFAFLSQRDKWGATNTAQYQAAVDSAVGFLLSTAIITTVGPRDDGYNPCGTGSCMGVFWYGAGESTYTTGLIAPAIAAYAASHADDVATTSGPLAGLSGARVVLTNAAGATVVDVTLAAGAFGGTGTRGWRANRHKTKWTYQDKTGTPNNGLTEMVILDRSRKAPNQVKVMMIGKNGTYPIAPGDKPIKATVVLGDRAASSAGQCGETAFAPTDCSFNASGNKLRCRH